MEIIFEDDALFVVVKPAQLLSVPGRKPENYDSVITRLQQDHEAHCVHRLDMATSGLMVVAKDKPTLKHLNKQFAERRVYKRYHALVSGSFAEDAFDPKNKTLTIEAPIICDWPNRPRQVIREDGKPSTTRLKLLQNADSSPCSLVELEPVTGRSHQLRIHLAHIGHPILGCEFYASDIIKSLAKRLCLHACELGFAHPKTGESLRFKSHLSFEAYLNNTKLAGRWWQSQ